MYFRDKLLEKIRCLERLRYLESKQGIMGEIEGDYEVKSAIERNSQITIDAINIGEMVISKEEGTRPPETYRELLLELGNLGIIPRELVVELSKMAGFRNVLVHQYEEADPLRLLEFIKFKLDDLRAFTQYVRSYLSRDRGSSV